VGYGGLAGGLTGAVGVPVVGALARGALNRQAQGATQLLRAQVATPGGVPMRALPPPSAMPAGLGALAGQGLNSVEDWRESLRNAFMGG
jgi:hypothetical protein